MSFEEKRAMIDKDHPNLSITRQCELLGISRSGIYYKPVPEDDEDTMFKRLIDKIFTDAPCYGSRKITKELQGRGYNINRKRVQRLMREMGLEAIYPKPNTSKPSKHHKKYPYLLRKLAITRPNQVWATDITYIRMNQGFIYLVAIMDWFSRYVLSWEVSNTLDETFCIEALQRALSKAKPDIFNSDQGSQFTSTAFTGILDAHGVQISMDGRGRALDNIFVERLWRSVKYEEVYLKDYRNVPEAMMHLSRYFNFYNNRRLHQSLDYKTPALVYQMGAQALIPAGV
jgi:putative transposase